MKIVAFDLSLANTGWATCDEVGSWRSKPSEYDSAEKAAKFLRRMARLVCDKAVNAELVVLESPALGSASGRAHARAGLWWMAYCSLTALGHRVVEVSPSQLKKWATGRGNAAKPDVLTSIIRLWPERDVKNEDEADALCLWTMAAQAVGQTDRGLTEARRTVLAKINWKAGSKKCISQA